VGRENSVARRETGDCLQKSEGKETQTQKPKGSREKTKNRTKKKLRSTQRRKAVFATMVVRSSTTKRRVREKSKGEPKGREYLLSSPQEKKRKMANLLLPRGERDNGRVDSGVRTSLSEKLARGKNQYEGGQGRQKEESAGTLTVSRRVSERVYGL